MTAADVVTEMRVVLRDAAGAGARWTDAELLAAVNRGGRLIMQQYGETRLQADGSLTDWTDAPTAGATLTLGDEHRNALIHAACACAYEGEQKDKLDRELTQYHRGMTESYFRAPRG